jgi:5'-3' exonuclease
MATQPARVHLVDGTFELFRAHYTQRPGHRAPDGSEMKATVGLAFAMVELLRDQSEAVTHLAVAFDNPIRSFRNALYDGYKTDDGMDPELRGQFDAAEEAVRALGITVWSMDEFEADDALAAGAARYGPEVGQVRILTPDKDLGQCLDGTHVVMVDRIRKSVTDEAALLARRGIKPESVPDFLALTGDDADGIPGVDGFGEKTAGALLQRYVHLEQIPKQPREWPSGVRGALRLAAALEAAGEDVLLYRTLATLRRDVPLPEPLAALEWRGVPRARFEAWCEKLGVTGLAARVPRFCER